MLRTCILPAVQHHHPLQSPAPGRSTALAARPRGGEEALAQARQCVVGTPAQRPARPPWPPSSSTWHCRAACGCKVNRVVSGLPIARVMGSGSPARCGPGPKFPGATPRCAARPCVWAMAAAAQSCSATGRFPRRAGAAPACSAPAAGQSTAAGVPLLHHLSKFALVCGGQSSCNNSPAPPNKRTAGLLSFVREARTALRCSRALPNRACGPWRAARSPSSPGTWGTGQGWAGGAVFAVGQALHAQGVVAGGARSTPSTASRPRPGG